MQLYWKCEECDETNLYPNVTVCETCGSPMTLAAEQRVLQEQKDEEKRQVQCRKEKERQRKKNLKAEKKEERQRKKVLKAIQQRENERKRVTQFEHILERREKSEKKFSNILRKCIHVLSKGLIYFAILSVIITVVLLFHNSANVNIYNSLQGVLKNIQVEYFAHTIVDEGRTEQEDNVRKNNNAQVSFMGQSERRVSRVVNKIENQLPIPFMGVFLNIEEQIEYLKITYKPANNLVVLFEDIVEFLSGGVEK